MQVPIELKLKYLKGRIKDLQNLKISLENDDFTLAMRLGHQVKGNAVTFDFPQMALIGLEIETAAMKRDKERVKLLAKKMENAISTASSGLKLPRTIVAS